MTTEQAVLAREAVCSRFVQAGFEQWYRPARRWARAKLRAGSPIILMYHRIGEVGEDPFGIAVSREHFAQQLAVLARRRTVISLQEMAARLQNGGALRSTAAITFDDGYADNLHTAKPILERHGMPATVYITPAAIDRSSEFWWDELGRILLQPGELPASLSIKIDGVLRSWTLDAIPFPSPGEHGQWRAWQPPPTSRHALYAELWHLLRSLADTVRDAAMAEIRAWAGTSRIMRPERRTLTSEELLQLARGDLIAIGAHTVSHPSLPQLAPAKREQEIRASKRVLEERLGRPIDTFAYPFGDHDAASIADVAAAGFLYACTTEPTYVRPKASLLTLPRYQVENWSGEEFERRLSMLFPA